MNVRTNMQFDGHSSTESKYLKDNTDLGRCSCIATKLLLSILIIYEEWYMELRSGGIPHMLQLLAICIAVSSFIELGGKVFELVQNRTFISWTLFGVISFLYSSFFGISESTSTTSLITFFSFLIICLCMGMVSAESGDSYWVNVPIIIVVVLSAYCSISNGYERLNTDSIVISMSANNNPNNLGLMMDIGVFSLVFPKEQQSIFKWLFRIVLVCVCYYVILRTGSRSALIGVIIISIYATFAHIRSVSGDQIEIILKRIGIAILCLTLFVGLFIYMVKKGTTGSSIERLLSGFNRDAFSGRTGLYSEAWEVFLDNPLFGVGYDCFKTLNKHSYFTHSTYMELLACTGIVGFFFYVYPIIPGFIDCMRISRIDKGRRLSLLLLLSVSGLFGILHYTLVFMMLFYLSICPDIEETVS